MYPWFEQAFSWKAARRWFLEERPLPSYFPNPDRGKRKTAETLRRDCSAEV